MRLAKEFRYDLPDDVVHRENVPQVDLAAMHYGLVMTEVPWDDAEIDQATAMDWARISFRWADDD